MLTFGHTGLAIAAAVLFTSLLSWKNVPESVEGKTMQLDTSDLQIDQSDARHSTSILSRVTQHIDIRLLLIGSLLPDIVDKPLGHVIFRDIFSNGRIFSHTLLVLTVVALAGLWLYHRYARKWLLILSFGVFTHLIGDQMWRFPRTLFWPICSFSFERVDVTHWVSKLLFALQTNAQVYMPELLGLIVLVWFIKELMIRRMVITFIKTGEVKD